MIKWHKTYFAMLATPLAVRDVVLAHLGFVLFRVGHDLRGVHRW